VDVDVRALWSQDVGTGRAAQAAFETLLAGYREAHRRYHTVRHALEVVRTCQRLLPAVTVADPAAVRIAALAHDAVYDSTQAPGVNEAMSADLASRVLVAASVGPDRVASVRRLVLSTAMHEPAATDEAVLIDADLAILAARPAVYAAYSNGVRAEYGHLDDATFSRGRTAFLRGMLDRPRLFHTAPMTERERAARANLSAELAQLTRRAVSGTTTSPSTG
jgi:predicted metal-dependent HD superfamily phosphohydrolase